MSVLHECVRCGAEWETGWGDDADAKCRECQKRDERLRRGGRTLTGNEMAAVADFLGADVALGDPEAFYVDSRWQECVSGNNGGAKMYSCIQRLTAFPRELTY